MVDTWADVYDDDHEEMQACEANPDPGSALGLCAEHEAQLAVTMKQHDPRRGVTRQNPGRPVTRNLAVRLQVSAS